MLNPKFIGLNFSCLPHHMPNYLFDISTWRKLRYPQLHVFKTKLAPPPDFLSMTSPSSLVTTAFLPHLLYTSNQQISPFSFESTYPATTLVLDPLSSTWIISTAFSTGFLSPVSYGILPFPDFFPLII